MTYDNIIKSLIMHLKEKSGLNVVWHAQGASLPGTLPFVLVEEMPANMRTLAKGREATEIIERFQVGLFTRTTAERSVLRQTMRDAFLDGAITYTDFTQKPPIDEGFFDCAITSEVPFNADSIDGRSNYNRVYYDVEIENLRYRGN